MRNPLTRDRLRAFLGGREDIIRAFEEIAQVADVAPDGIAEAQALSALNAESVSQAKADVARLTRAVEALTLAVLLDRNGTAQMSALTRRVEDLESRLLAAP